MAMNPPRPRPPVELGGLFAAAFFGVLVVIFGIAISGSTGGEEQEPYYLGYQGDWYDPSKSNANGSQLVFDTGEDVVFAVTTSEKPLAEQVVTSAPDAVEVRIVDASGERSYLGYLTPAQAGEVSELGLGAGTTKFIGNYYTNTDGVAFEDVNALWDEFVSDLYVDDEPTFMYPEASTSGSGFPAWLYIGFAIIGLSIGVITSVLLRRFLRRRKAHAELSKFLRSQTLEVQRTEPILNRSTIEARLQSVASIIWGGSTENGRRRIKANFYWYDSPEDVAIAVRNRTPEHLLNHNIPVVTHRHLSAENFNTWNAALVTWGISHGLIPPSRVFRDDAFTINSISHARDLVMRHAVSDLSDTQMVDGENDALVNALARYLSKNMDAGSRDFRNAVSVLTEVASKVEFLGMTRSHDFVIVENPVERHFDDQGRLHHDDGPAVIYGGDTASKVYAVHGVVVSEDIFNGTASIEDVLGEPNSEVRRVAIERLGWEHFIDEGGFTIIDQADDPGNPGQRLRLYDMPMDMPDNGVNRVLVCVNGTVEKDGSRRTFGQLVPADISDAVGAAAWTYGLDKGEYVTAQRRS